MSTKKAISGKGKAKLWCTVRVSSDTRKAAEAILKIANEKPNGRKIKLHEVIQAGLELIQSRHIQELQEKSLTHEDRKEILRQKYIATRGPISKDEFTGFMMTAEFATFLTEQNFAVSA